MQAMAENMERLSHPIAKLNALYKWLKDNEIKLSEPRSARIVVFAADSAHAQPLQARRELQDFQEFVRGIQSANTQGQLSLNL